MSCRSRVGAVGWLTGMSIFAGAHAITAHEGPPFPIVSNQMAGSYEISVWTDPDTTDDGTPGGQFWVYVHSFDDGPVPADTRATVAISPLDRDGPTLTARAEPVEGHTSQHFAALVMDHEGRFAVVVEVEGPAGRAAVNAEVEGTYDQRPPAPLLLLFILPFALVGFLWLKLLLRRRH